MAENNNDVNAGDEHGSATPSDNLKAESGSSGRKGETAPTKVGPADQPAGVLSSDEAKAAAIEAAKQRVAAAKAQSVDAGASAPSPPRPPVKKKEEGPLPTDASNDPLVKSLKNAFGDDIVEALEFIGQISVRVAPDRIVAVSDYLRRHPDSPFEFLADLTCVHFPERAGAEFDVVYNLCSMRANRRIRIKVAVNGDSAVDSVCEVWPTANWMEREVYDLFGLRFNNHPDLRRLLLPDDWTGHPLRKEHPLQFSENDWTEKHLPEFSEVQKEQLEQRRVYGLAELSSPGERKVREKMREGREIMPLDRK